jgi:hypothetical protein
MLYYSGVIWYLWEFVDCKGTASGCREGLSVRGGTQEGAKRDTLVGKGNKPSKFKLGHL